MTHEQFKKMLDEELEEIKEFLVRKNEAYGNSALRPVRIFSKASPIEQINVRLDDKVNRLMNGNKYPGDDDELDILGYLILKRMAKRENGFQNKYKE